jgi:pheromone a factor receptor
MFWCGLGCLNMFINSIVWNGNAINWAPVWCDISSRIVLGVSFAIPAASLCINRRLYHIASAQTVTVSRAEKRRAVMVDLAIGLGYPCLMIALQYIVQGHRFNIFEDVGCFPFTYNTPPAFVLVHCQPVLIGLVSAVYCGLSIRLFKKRNDQFNELLSGHKNLTSNRYIRLMCLAGIEMACTIPIGAWTIAVNVMAGTFPWLGWADTHFGFSRVDLIPAIFWRNDPSSVNGLEFTRWSIVACSLVFFAFFGFADEARKNYRSAVETVAKKVGISTFTLTGTKTGSSATSTLDGGNTSKGTVSSTGKIRPVPPVHIHTDMLSRRSLDSFTNISVSFNDAGNLLDEKEKGFSPDASFGALSMNEISGTVPDYNSDSLSSPSSGSSSASSSASSPSRSSISLPAQDTPKQSDRSAV